MTPSTLLIGSILALLFSAFAATAAKLLYEFARHELEDFCRKRNRLGDYDQVIESREQLAVGAETLQILCLVVAIVFALIWGTKAGLLQTELPIQIVGIVSIFTVLVWATNSWIPLVVLNVAAAPFLYYTWRIWWYVTLVAKPLSIIFGFLVVVIRRASGRQYDGEDEEEAFEDEIRSMVSEGERDGFLDLDAREMIEGVIELDDKDVAEVMTPKKDVIAIEVNTEWNELLKFVSENNKTRIPVYEDELSNVIGFLHTKDLLPEFLKSENERLTLRELIREAMFVPESLLVDELLQRFQEKRKHMAIVLDEYGSIAGLITIEDILEEIVGEIVDETEPEPDPIFFRIDENTIQTKGTAKIEKLNDELDWELPEDLEFDTVGGLMMFQLRDIPHDRVTMQYGDFEFEAIGESHRTIDRVRVRKLSTSELNGNGDSHFDTQSDE